MSNIKDLRIEKITLNIGVGEPGDKLNKAMKLLETITNKKPVQTITMKRIPTWGVRPGLKIGCKVTLRKKRAEEVLARILVAKENKLEESKFDKEGNVSFGIKEYLEVPGVDYDPQIGIIGLEMAVTLERMGFRIKRRHNQKRRIKQKQRITKEEAIRFMQEKFKVKVGEQA